MPGFVLGRLDGKVEELDLTPVQKAKYDEVRAQLKTHLLAAREDRKKFRELLRTELAKESPDVAVLSAIMKKKIQGISGTMQNDLDLLATFYSTLDDGQKQKVMSGIREKWPGWTVAGRKQNENSHEERVYDSERRTGRNCSELPGTTLTRPVGRKSARCRADFPESNCSSKDKAGKKILVAYASSCGSTGAVAEAIGRPCATPASMWTYASRST